jgi:hypothetical protein
MGKTYVVGRKYRLIVERFFLGGGFSIVAELMGYSVEPTAYSNRRSVSVPKVSEPGARKRIQIREGTGTLLPHKETGILGWYPKVPAVFRNRWDPLLLVFTNPESPSFSASQDYQIYITKSYFWLPFGTMSYQQCGLLKKRA